MISELDEQKIDFFIAALEATRKCSQAEFKCPICGGIACAIKSPRNGHRKSVCGNCHVKFIQ